MSHTINPNQPRLQNAHPPNRGSGRSLIPPPTNRSGFVPPHLQHRANASAGSTTLAPMIGGHHGVPLNTNGGLNGLAGLDDPNNENNRQHNFGLDNRFGPLGDPGFNSVGNRYTDFGSTDGVNDHNYHQAGHDGNFNANQDDTETLEDNTRMTDVTINVDHEALQSIFGLSEAKRALAQRVLEMNQENILGALVYGIFSLQPGGTLISLQPGANNTPPVAPTPVIDIRNYRYGEYIKDDIRDFIQSKILEARNVGYSGANDANGAPEPLALLNSTHAHVASLPAAIITAHLPPGYSQGNQPSQRSVSRLVRTLLKYERVTVRNLLLKNIVDTSYAKVTGAAPCLEVLFNQINHALRSRDGVHVPLVIWDDIPMRVKVRFAYLRLQTAAHALNPTNTHGSQWTPIDHHLQMLSNQTAEYIRCWAILIIQKDEQMFGLGGVIYSSVRHLPHLPTQEEVENEVAQARLVPATTTVGNDAATAAATV
ncbi:hypothetical protein PSTT_12056 [Puccinia striiformis]|uniref:Uncharacterized protein n=1 Tax=Puccinia striiformis TaxID=27350 RepID=A0A2S4UXQ8_9BASI|nr:hypothetical protein PSTT_12056 [Puccinia striiformis]